MALRPRKLAQQGIHRSAILARACGPFGGHCVTALARHASLSDRPQDIEPQATPAGRWRNISTILNKRNGAVKRRDTSAAVAAMFVHRPVALAFRFCTLRFLNAPAGTCSTRVARRNTSLTLGNGGARRKFPSELKSSLPTGREAKRRSDGNGR